MQPDFDSSRVISVWDHPSPRFGNIASLHPQQSLLPQLCQTLKTTLVNSPLFLPILVLLELLLKFYLMTEVTFLNSTWMMRMMM
ncbi:hypothetical protein L873DRAFT_1326760 [Choiromyces venosus 120613-1]|uniref:Uncharacterized protein n=1 Tax=Choiromyces venosus 120613-1 TaxID=1336337 RepID=A0A3N4JAP1_9PEZI|nr:hypothetical protein L873DRAFT_1326760 [Choiromyces venosus 120613-1]